jgi:hypothetical protein
MNNFRRTTSGLNNLYLFHNVDFTVFLEGGKVSFNKAQVFEGSFHTETDDIIFWGNIFNNFQFKGKIKFKSIGSKSTVKEIALDIKNGLLNKVLVAMDNEFDEILEKRILHPNIYYTHGYSWENDIWNHDIVKAIIEDLTAIKIKNDDLQKVFSDFEKKIKLAVLADGYLFSKNKSFFPKKKGCMFCVDFQSLDLPKIKNQEIEAKINIEGLKKSTLYAFGRKHSINSLKFCYGHFLADYCCQLILNFIKKRHGLTSISKDILYRLGIRKFFQISFQQSHIYEFYENQFKR